MNLLKNKFTDTIKSKIKGKKKKTIILVSVIVLILVLFLISKIFGGNDIKAQLKEVKASKNTIQTSISGTATIEANAQYDVTSLVKGEIISDNFTEGQVIEKGDVLYQIDTTDAENSLNRARLSYEKAQNSYNTTMRNAGKLNVSSDTAGTITNMYVKLGDSVNTGTKICDVIDSKNLIIKLPFIYEQACEIYEGEAASVTLLSTGQVLNGVVKRVSSGGITNELGVIVGYVDIALTNPGALKEGEEAVAVVGNYACQDSSVLEFNSTKTVTAEASGTVVSILRDIGDEILPGETIVKLESASVTESVDNSRLSLREAQLSLENSEDVLDDYTITAPISGTVIQKNSKAGDTLDNSNSTKVMCVIADYSKTTIKLNIDELDLASVSVGQKVNIEADAFPGVRYTGYVDYISQVGTSSVGATSYPVTIVIENPDNLIVGMNVTAEIITKSAENVVCVPQEAIKRGNIVFVKKSDVSQNPKLADERFTKNLEIPDGYVAVMVETGLTDGIFTEIKSGIEENDTVAYYLMISEDSGNYPNTNSPMGNMQRSQGIPGGGMPSGAMPGGGMPSGGMRGGGF